MNVFEMIEAQQKGREGTTAFMVGEQLKAICRAEPDSAELVAQDLTNKAMSLEAAAGKIKERADELHKKLKGNCVCVTPEVEEGIIRKFYGLPEGAGNLRRAVTAILEKFGKELGGMNENGVELCKYCYWYERDLGLCLFSTRERGEKESCEFWQPMDEEEG